ncbi:NmrA family NAD(P)-binding protein [Herminiimonas fonticola]|uniref:Uncharacterized protein YbjT (DUF2867 family) n=1 Tax=Herminiimonas fonticola TaxID=303380 RepID=A0A4R6GGY6_9BURK|nr:NmrA family NAD(P)-binding protein [Herminiimonas fonticola]RBA25104.1 NmrA-like family [Herminiimonas fonticola]TDN94219.1 uncharacterized protein YbjT (DUF2867 family) [Herminiimonas fonticola]
MFAVTGITGQVGSVLARSLLAAGKDVRAVVRNAQKGADWAARGCDVAIAEMNDVDALQKAFSDVEGVFVMLPSNFDPTPGFPESRQTIAAIRTALKAAQPAKVVCLSTIGAHATQTNLLSQLGILEQELGTLSIPVSFLRAAWFLENAAWDIAPARVDRLISSFLQPLDKLVPMVATADVGRVAAELLQQTWSGHRVVNLEGPRRIKPLEIAEAFSKVLGHTVQIDAVPRQTWESLFTSQGMKNPTPRMQMLDGFNEGWIEFENDGVPVRKGEVTLETVLQALLEKDDER